MYRKVVFCGAYVSKPVLFFQRWTANRQMAYEGGFQGRTNKLVDGCYSFWQGGAFPLIHMILSMHGKCTFYDTYSVSYKQVLSQSFGLAVS